MYQGSTQDQKYDSRDDFADWINLGYIASDKVSVSCSKTLEYAYDDWALANLALALGNKADYQIFLNRSMNYKNVWNDDEKLFCPRSSTNKWDCPWLWTDVFDSRYVEGDAWHWRWFVPHDISGLIRLFGSNKTFVEQLEVFFERSQDDPLTILPNPYYWAGNEPDILAVWMFDFAGRADLTQRFSRMVMRTSFNPGPDGLPGNDDYGTMSAWYVFASLGFYPLAGSTRYMLGSPIFERTVLQSEDWKLEIIANNASRRNIYVQKAVIGNRVIDMKDYPFIFHNELQNTTLEFWMSDHPPKFYSK